MKIAVLTANIGKIDSIKGIPKQSLDCDFFYYTEDNLPYPLPNLNNRLRSKYLKTQTHRFLPDYDIYIWIDGSIRVHGGNFVENYMEHLKNHDIAIYLHNERKNVYEEMEYIDLQLKKGNDYLLSRYGDQQMVKEALFYAKNQLPEDYPLFNCFTFVRCNSKKANQCFDEWWKRCIEFSNFDQAMFSYVTWESKIKINKLRIDPDRTYKLFAREKHL